MNQHILILVSSMLLTVCGSSLKEIFAADENLVCNIKQSCVECLRLSHCSWCPSESKCFSKTLATTDFCKNQTVDVIDHGYSLQDNAKCACIPDELEQNCSPPGAEDGTECSGRGKCVCGRCICNSPFDAINPTKFIVGEYCDFDNFSCDGPRCTEGPYPLVQIENDASKTSETGE